MTFHDDIHRDSENSFVISINYLFLYYGTIAPIPAEISSKFIDSLKEMCDHMGYEYTPDEYGVFQIK